MFISHASADNAAAAALHAWLREQGFDDVFLDIDAKRGLVPGERWQEALKAATNRCEAVLCLISPAWLASKWCNAELLTSKLLHKRVFGLIVEPVAIEQVPVEMKAEWQLCELTGEDRFRTFEVEVLGRASQVAFREAGLDLLRRGLLRAGLDARSFPWPPPDEPNRAPYRGLKALEPQDAAVFFGRDAWIVRGLDRIRGLVEGGVEHLLVILGASGSGKSSFLRAGLWPRLLRDDAQFLPLPVIRPQSAVIGASSGLAASLAGAFERLGAARAAGHIKETLRDAGGFAGLLDELAELAQRRLAVIDLEAVAPVIVLPLDQAEELFNPEGAAEAAQFLDLLSAALAPAQHKTRLLVVATMRSDRYELLQAAPRLTEIERALFDLPPLSAVEFRGVIEGPTRRTVEAGGRLAIEPALTERLIADAEGADALPLLGFTLERLYADYGPAGQFTLADYERLGGVQGSIEAAVAAALAEPGRAPAIPPDREAQYATLRAAFIPWLARIDPESGAPIRRLAQRDEISGMSRALVERLIEARLVVADRRDGADVIEVAHESLLRQWPALTAWLDADAADLIAVEGIERAAAEWLRNDRGEAWLDHRGERLATANALAAREDFGRRLGPDGIAYVAACRVREQAELQEREAALTREQARLAEIAAAQARTSRLQRIVAVGLAAVVLLVATGSGVVWWQRQANLRQAAALVEQRVALLADLAQAERNGGRPTGGLRLAAYSVECASDIDPHAPSKAGARDELAASASQAQWRRVLAGHEDLLWSAAYSPDGSRIVTASADNTARVWDAASGKEVVALRGHEGPVRSATYSPDGLRIVTASSDKTARVWDAASGREILALRGHEGVVSSAAYSPDGLRIVTASWDKTARVWDAASGKEIVALRGHEGWVRSAAYSPDGSRIVTASEDKTARVWDAASGKEIVALRGHEDRVWSVAYSPDGSRIVTASWDKTARVWDAASGKEIVALRGHEGVVYSAAYSPDGSRIVTASEDKTARLWDATSGKEVAALRGHEDQVVSATYSPDESRIVTASWDKTARVWDAASGKEIVALRGHEGPVSSAAYSPDGSRIVTASEDKTARVWDAASGKEIVALRGHEGPVSSAAYSPDGSRIVTASSDKTARVWDAASGKEVVALRGHEDQVLSAAYSPDGSRIVTASSDKTARVWDTASGKEILALRGHDDLVLSAAYSPDGSHIVTASLWDKTARVWDAASGKEIIALHGHEGWVWSAAYSPDGSRIVTASADKTARVWDAVSGKEVVALRGHEGMVLSAAYSPGGSRVVTASEDNTARVWDAASGKEIVALRGHEGWVRSAAYSPDRSRIVTASSDKTARVWDAHVAAMATDKLLVEVCGRQLRGTSVLTRDEMRLIGEPDDKPQIDVCAGIAR